MTAHTCHAAGCAKPVPPRVLMCLPHWRMVPRDIQAGVWATYLRGQEVTKDPTPEYLGAVKAAVSAVAAQERADFTPFQSAEVAKGEQ